MKAKTRNHIIRTIAGLTVTGAAMYFIVNHQHPSKIKKPEDYSRVLEIKKTLRSKLKIEDLLEETSFEEITKKYRDIKREKDSLENLPQYAENLTKYREKYKKKAREAPLVLFGSLLLMGVGIGVPEIYLLDDYWGRQAKKGDKQ